ncbi:MAG TPA: glycine cleavage T C-terminal barrel domain-containing protein [Solirubrobacterales bacterium]|jgi:folate-binding protein YgfZ|nr:glycine cleavage T C-terminal barrel domain-containing protein [Solirubrobacterales bacterium]
MPVTSAPSVELDAQYRVLREGAGLLDRSGRGKITVSGDEAAEYLQGQLTNDVEALVAEQGCYALLLDRKGHIQADMRVLRLGTGEIWLDLEPAATEPTLRHLRMYSVGRELAIEDVSERWAIVSLLGPAAASIAGLEGLGPEHAQRVREADGIEVRAVATDAGLDLIVSADQAEALRAKLLEAGAEPVSEEAAEIVRIESGRPRFGRELSPRAMPAEAGVVERAIDFDKGCYIGQEPVARLHYRGKPNRRLRGLRLSAAVEPGAALRLGDREVGTVGSAGVSPACGPIALAIVRREAEPGATLAVEGGASAELVELPFRNS